MIDRILGCISRIEDEQINPKTKIVERLLTNYQITFEEATLLLKSVNIEINADKIEMSSGAKIIGGCDFETTDMSR